MLVAGFIATMAFDGFGQDFSPALGFATLAPVPLAQQTLGVLFGDLGESARSIAYGVHTVTGVLVYPFGYAFIAMPLARAIIPSIPWWIVAVAYGLVLWVFALYVMAHLVAGNPPFLGFTGITWVALVGHVLFAFVVGLILSPRHE